MLFHANHDECNAAGIDPVEVENLARRMARVMRDANRMGLVCFGGSCSLNFRFTDGKGGPLIVADCMGDNCDGGDGATSLDANRLLRGED